MNQVGKTKWVEVFEADKEQVQTLQRSHSLKKKRILKKYILFLRAVNTLNFKPASRAQGKGAGTGTAAYGSTEEVAQAIATLNGSEA